MEYGKILVLQGCRLRCIGIRLNTPRYIGWLVSFKSDITWDATTTAYFSKWYEYASDPPSSGARWQIQARNTCSGRHGSHVSSLFPTPTGFFTAIVPHSLFLPSSCSHLSWRREPNIQLWVVQRLFQLPHCLARVSDGGNVERRYVGSVHLFGFVKMMTGTYPLFSPYVIYFMSAVGIFLTLSRGLNMT